MDKKQTYLIYIKSHCEAPDYENECEAISKLQAARIFQKQLNRPYITEEDGAYSADWDIKDIYPHIATHKEIDEWTQRTREAINAVS